MLSVYFQIILALILQYTEADFAYTHHHVCNHATIEWGTPNNITETTTDNERANTVVELGGGRVKWSAYNKLDWYDFNGTPDTTLKRFAALSYTAVVYSHYCENGYLGSNVEAVFKTTESWVRPEARNDYYLEHERIHFDITELHARKLRDALAKYKFTCNQEADFLRVVESVLDKWREMDRQYDRETSFSHNKYRQRDWYIFIHTKLQEYQEYAEKI